MEQWYVALGYALGADRTPTIAGPPALDPVVAALGGIGRVIELADAERDAGRPWPRPVERPAAVGPAQWSALLNAAARSVGQTRAERAGRVLGTRTADADELRLLRDVPPHHGS